MSVESWIGQITKRIIHEVHPKKIILFGSYAYGKPRKDSDIDILVILDKPKNRIARYTMVDEAIGDHIYPLDILVRSPEEIKKRLKMGDTLMEEIFEKGQTLYEARS